MCKGQIALDTAMAWNLEFDPDQSNMPSVAVAEPTERLGMANGQGASYGPTVAGKTAGSSSDGIDNVKKDGNGSSCLINWKDKAKTPLVVVSTTTTIRMFSLLCYKKLISLLKINHRFW
ncbi:hypothetical protein P4T04_18060 [Bacillus badius]|uniref:hypothetical protein n=1 Tax=Bacillus badius TaxID=1455 RepID=UPI002E209C29|nr:hypothetical protein [Bacillus badius]